MRYQHCIEATRMLQKGDYIFSVWGGYVEDIVGDAVYGRILQRFICFYHTKVTEKASIQDTATDKLPVSVLLSIVRFNILQILRFNILKILSYRYIFSINSTVATVIKATRLHSSFKIKAFNLSITVQYMIPVHRKAHPIINR